MRKITMWYDKNGRPLDTVVFAENPELYQKQHKKINDLLSNREYKVIKQQHLWWGGFLSTVWLGLDHCWFGNRKPVIFETMLFFRHKSVDCIRYSTLIEAKFGHKSAYWEYSNPIYLLKCLINYCITWYERNNTRKSV